MAQLLHRTQTAYEAVRTNHIQSLLRLGRDGWSVPTICRSGARSGIEPSEPPGPGATRIAGRRRSRVGGNSCPSRSCRGTQPRDQRDLARVQVRRHVVQLGEVSGSLDAFSTLEGHGGSSAQGSVRARIYGVANGLGRPTRSHGQTTTTISDGRHDELRAPAPPSWRVPCTISLSIRAGHGIDDKASVHGLLPETAAVAAADLWPHGRAHVAVITCPLSRAAASSTSPRSSLSLHGVSADIEPLAASGQKVSASGADVTGHVASTAIRFFAIYWRRARRVVVRRSNLLSIY